MVMDCAGGFHGFAVKTTLSGNIFAHVTPCLCEGTDSQSGVSGCGAAPLILQEPPNRVPRTNCLIVTANCVLLEMK